MVFKSIRDSLVAAALTWASACPPAVSSKIIPRISREAGPPATVRSQRTFVLAHQTGLPSAGHHHALVLDSYDRFVRLFTPVSAEEAGRLERGVPLDGPLYWTDRPVPEETDADAIWIVLTIPNEDLAGANEQSVHPRPGISGVRIAAWSSAYVSSGTAGPADCLGGDFAAAADQQIRCSAAVCGWP
jgi:hypothetical protein